jgi:hypothetical protein
MDPHPFVQRPVERGAMVAKLLPQRLLGLGTDEVSRGASARSCSCSGRATAPS